MTLEKTMETVDQIMKPFSESAGNLVKEDIRHRREILGIMANPIANINAMCKGVNTFDPDLVVLMSVIHEFCDVVDQSYRILGQIDRAVECESHQESLRILKSLEPELDALGKRAEDFKLVVERLVTKELIGKLVIAIASKQGA